MYQDLTHSHVWSCSTLEKKKCVRWYPLWFHSLSSWIASLNYHHMSPLSYIPALFVHWGHSSLLGEKKLHVIGELPFSSGYCEACGLSSLQARQTTTDQSPETASVWGEMWPMLRSIMFICLFLNRSASQIGSDSEVRANCRVHLVTRLQDRSRYTESVNRKKNQRPEQSHWRVSPRQHEELNAACFNGIFHRLPCSEKFTLNLKSTVRFINRNVWNN